jgi:hypothetical protein
MSYIQFTLVATHIAPLLEVSKNTKIHVNEMVQGPCAHVVLHLLISQIEQLLTSHRGN